MPASARRKKGALSSVLQKRGKGNKIMAIVDRRSLPVAVYVASASPNEVRLIDETLADRFLDVYPPRLIGDRAYDSDPLDPRDCGQSMALSSLRRIVTVASLATQDRSLLLRRYKRRAGSSNASLRGCTIPDAPLVAGNATSSNFFGMLQLASHAEFCCGRL